MKLRTALPVAIVLPVTLAPALAWGAPPSSVTTRLEYQRDRAAEACASEAAKVGPWSPRPWSLRPHTRIPGPTNPILLRFGLGAALGFGSAPRVARGVLGRERPGHLGASPSNNRSRRTVSFIVVCTDIAAELQRQIHALAIEAQGSLIERQQSAIFAMSTPIIEIWSGPRGTCTADGARRHCGRHAVLP